MYLVSVSPAPTALKNRDTNGTFTVYSVVDNQIGCVSASSPADRRIQSRFTNIRLLHVEN